MDGSSSVSLPPSLIKSIRGHSTEGESERGKGSKEEVRGESEQYNWRQFERTRETD